LKERDAFLAITFFFVRFGGLGVVRFLPNPQSPRLAIKAGSLAQLSIGGQLSSLAYRRRTDTKPHLLESLSLIP
jgi:hypothetical protein